MKTTPKRIWIATITSLLLFLFGIYQVFGQSTKYDPKGSIAIAVYQDAKFLVVGDNKGNSPGTLDLIFRVKLQGNQDRLGYCIIFPEYEYANLKGGKYVRYSANVGYVFNQLIKNIETSLAVGYGWIDRNGTLGSISINSELAYKVTDNLKLSVIGQYTQRQDIRIWRYSSFLGVELRL